MKLWLILYHELGWFFRYMNCGLQETCTQCLTNIMASYSMIGQFLILSVSIQPRLIPQWTAMYIEAFIVYGRFSPLSYFIMPTLCSPQCLVHSSCKISQKPEKYRAVCEINILTITVVTRTKISLVLLFHRIVCSVVQCAIH